MRPPASPPIGARDAAPPRPEDEVPDIPRGVPADDWTATREWPRIADLDAGPGADPEEWEIEGPAATISLGDAADVDLWTWPRWWARTGSAARCSRRTGRRTRCARPGARRADRAGRRGSRPADRQPGHQRDVRARRLAARAAWLELAAVAEFTRRREAQLEAATAAKVPRGCRDGEFPDAELGMELVTSQNAARDTMDLAGDLQTRLPRTWAALGAG